MQNSKALHKWYTNKITNLHYLMKLNYIASRSYSDLTQYPVFPWILHDGSQLNQYRNLAKSMGGIGPAERLEVF